MNYEPLIQKYSRERLETTSMLDKWLMHRLLKYLRPYMNFVILAVGLLVVAKGIEVFVPIYIGSTAQQIIDGAAQSKGFQQDLLKQVVYSCLMIIVLLFISYLLDMCSMVLKNWLAQKVLFTLRSQVYNHIQRLPVSYFDHNAVGRLMTRTIHDIDQIGLMFSESVIPILGSLVLFTCMCIGIAWVDWRIAIVFVAVVPMVGWLTFHFQRHQRLCYNLIRDVVAAMNTFVQEHLMGVSTIRNFGLQREEERQFSEINEDHRIANITTIHHFSYFIAGIDLLQNIALIGAFLTLELFPAPGATGFPVGAYFTFSLFVIMFFRPLVDLAERYNILQSAMAASERVFHILDIPEELQGGSSKLHKLEEISSIVFEDVWFAYDSDNWILKGLNFEINRGESVAFVGVTGVGKTTIINLLLRFYEVQKGMIKINGINILDYPLHEVRRLFSVVLQDPMIFSGTILDNISLYDPNINLKQIEKVVDFINMRSLIAKFSDGLSHQLTERGQSLSVGEMQMISLARAVAHGRSGFMLDEATANIDIATEHLIQNALKKVLKNKTAIVIAHRLSTIKDVTRIAVLHEGVIAEMGTHEELLEQEGLYEKLYRVQFKDL